MGAKLAQWAWKRLLRRRVQLWSVRSPSTLALLQPPKVEQTLQQPLQHAAPVGEVLPCRESPKQALPPLSSVEPPHHKQVWQTVPFWAPDR